MNAWAWAQGGDRQQRSTRDLFGASDCGVGHKDVKSGDYADSTI